MYLAILLAWYKSADKICAFALCVRVEHCIKETCYGDITNKIYVLLEVSSLIDRLIVVRPAVTCIEEGMGRLSIAEMQGVLRLGVKDMDVNYERNAALLQWLKDTKSRGSFPDHDAC